MKYIKRHIKKIELIVEVVFLVALFLLGFFLDYKYAASLFWQYYLFMAVLALILLLPVYLQSRRKQELWLFIGFNLSIFALYFVTLSPVKPFMQFYSDIKHGMTIPEVQSRFNQRFPKGGRFPQPLGEFIGGNEDVLEKTDPVVYDQHLNYILDPNDGRYNAEVVNVYFKDGKVLEVKYSGD
ncbi:hypothetical protein ACX27_26585 [Nostoc piscinale CENA21]|uniref:Uncharacterized protein n=1 Tax=Nostoc piscinale CENA21 TaxID=224013 RepID=A0A0M4U006_9NOSO|nr:hypothetical protein [Nostoc piscinale]ALF55601.1 hypothetical protein ACX27_26585 [Nostoc piscinale CENA21]